MVPSKLVFLHEMGVKDFYQIGQQEMGLGQCSFKIIIHLALQFETIFIEN